MTRGVMLLGFLAGALCFSQGPDQQSSLPSCPNTTYWDHCRGSRTYLGGDEYVGEFYSNASNGRGTYTFAHGKYVGEFRDGAFSGQGTETFSNGTKYVGEFRGTMFNGQGTLTYAESDPDVNPFPGGAFNGTGAYLVAANGNKYVSEGDVYVGEFYNNLANGQGTYTLANGDKYAGRFEKGVFHGMGIYTFSNGTKQIGQFKNGRYTETAVTAPTATPDLNPTTGLVPASSNGAGTPSFEVVLHPQHGVLLVPVVINDKITLDFVLDSGASDVSIPADVVLTLVRTGTLTKADFTGTATYILADGSRVPSQTFRIRSLKVGDKVLQNVSGSVASVKGTLLLGQSFLNRFKSWSIDNARQVLLLQ